MQVLSKFVIDHPELVTALGAVVATWITQMMTTQWVRVHVPPKGKLRRTIHWLHGILDRIDTNDPV